MIDQYLSYLVGSFGLLGFYFAGKKVWWSWYINLACQILWVMFALVTGYHAFLATAAVYSIIFGINAYKWTKEHLMIKKWFGEDELTPRGEQEESNLIRHARTELERIGEDPEVIEWFLRVIDEYRSFGHSGGSHVTILPVLNRLLDFKPLTPLTDDPSEWYYHGPDMWDGTNGVWQNVRNGEAFSNDGGKTYTLNSDEEVVKGGSKPAYISEKI